MMKLKEVLGLPILLDKDNKKVGNIKDIIVNIKNKTISGFMLERRNTEFVKKAINFSDISGFYHDHVTISGKEKILKWKDIREENTDVLSVGFCDLDIVNENKDWIGYACDMYFEMEDGRIRELEVSDGFIEDLLGGRKRMPVLANVEFSEEFIVVDNEAVEEMSSSGKGLRNLLKRLHNKNDISKIN